MLVIGIDPGISGGLAFISENEVKAVKMPETERDIWDCINAEIQKCKYWKDILIIIEKVHAFPGKQGISSTWKFAQNYGFLRGLVVALECQLIDISPQKWMKEFVITSSKGKTKTQHKNELKQKAQQFFPQLKITLATSDALL